MHEEHEADVLRAEILAIQTTTERQMRAVGDAPIKIGSRELWTGSRCVRLQEQPFVILQMLLEQRPSGDA